MTAKPPTEYHLEKIARHAIDNPAIVPTNMTNEPALS